MPDPAPTAIPSVATPTQPPAQPNADRKASGAFSTKSAWIAIILVLTAAMAYLVMSQSAAPSKSSKSDKEREKTARSVAAARERTSNTDFRSRIEQMAEDARKTAAQRMAASGQAGGSVEQPATGASVPQTPSVNGATTYPAYPEPPLSNDASRTTARGASSPNTAGPPSSGPDPQASLRNLELQIEMEARKKEAHSLSAELIVYNTRGRATHARADAPDAPRPSQSARAATPASAQPPPFVAQPAASSPPPPAQPNAEDTAEAAAPASNRADAARLRRQNAANRSVAPTHRLFEGTVIETVLTNRLDGTYTGPVNCMVTIDVWSHNREHLLIPQGTRVLGEAKRENALGQQRLAVTFHRMIMPDGYSVPLDQFTAMNQIGETGLKDKVNNHYTQIFGTSLALGAIAGLSTRGATYGMNQSAGDTWRQGFSQQVSSDATRILDRFMNVLPTITIREGNRVKVYLTDDLLLPAYAGHRMSSNL